ncbi:MAG: hypothetical protein SWH61_09480 [Thermodesulfobacteriota bacterium]|nr:hypothetical protein [Thermodesulfobacteriota bacterium]
MNSKKSIVGLIEIAIERKRKWLSGRIALSISPLSSEAPQSEI